MIKNKLLLKRQVYLAFERLPREIRELINYNTYCVPANMIIRFAANNTSFEAAEKEIANFNALCEQWVKSLENSDDIAPRARLAAEKKTVA